MWLEQGEWWEMMSEMLVGAAPVLNVRDRRMNMPLSVPSMSSKIIIDCSNEVVALGEV